MSTNKDTFWRCQSHMMATYGLFDKSRSNRSDRHIRYMLARPLASLQLDSLKNLVNDEECQEQYTKLIEIMREITKREIASTSTSASPDDFAYCVLKSYDVCQELRPLLNWQAKCELWSHEHLIKTTNMICCSLLGCYLGLNVRPMYWVPVVAPFAFVITQWTLALSRKDQYI